MKGESKVQTLKSAFKAKIGRPDELVEARKDRKVFAHFMLGNTYSFTEDDWEKTFALAIDTGLDGFALNLGKEDWQLRQAETAYHLLSKRKNNAFRLFISLDMNILSSSSSEDGQSLIHLLSKVMSSSAQLIWKDRPVLSTFGGHDARFGDWGWEGFLKYLNEALDLKVFFMPAFFLPPNDFIRLQFVDGTFGWNTAWPQGDHSIGCVEDETFAEGEKPYMAAVSPLFFTHYGDKGEWAFNKNWIYRFDDLLYPWRWKSLISLPPARSPTFIQVISWNDYGESHAIAPVLGDEPGSFRWTKDMPHGAFREMTKYFTGIWRDGLDEAGDSTGLRVWAWWRCHPKDAKARNDVVGRPDHAEWAQDLLNFVVVIPDVEAAFHMVIHNGGLPQQQHLETGQMNLIKIPFVPGSVDFEIIRGSDQVVLKGSGKEISSEIEEYNFNVWSGSWSAEVDLLSPQRSP